MCLFCVFLQKSVWNLGFLLPCVLLPTPTKFNLSILGLFTLRNLLPISHVCIEDGEKPMVLLPYMNWGNLKLFLRQCKLAEANNPQVRPLQNVFYFIFK